MRAANVVPRCSTCAWRTAPCGGCRDKHRRSRMAASRKDSWPRYLRFLGSFAPESPTWAEPLDKP